LKQKINTWLVGADWVNIMKEKIDTPLPDTAAAYDFQNWRWSEKKFAPPFPNARLAWLRGMRLINEQDAGSRVFPALCETGAERPLVSFSHEYAHPEKLGKALVIQSLLSDPDWQDLDRAMRPVWEAYCVERENVRAQITAAQVERDRLVAAKEAAEKTLAEKFGGGIEAMSAKIRGLTQSFVGW
jgi:hypothetical protein